MNRKSDRYRKLMRRSLFGHYFAGIFSLVTGVILASLLTAGAGSLIALAEMAVIMWLELAPGLIVTKTLVGFAASIICIAPFAGIALVPAINGAAREQVEEIIKEENDSIMNALGEANA